MGTPTKFLYDTAEKDKEDLRRNPEIKVVFLFPFV